MLTIVEKDWRAMGDDTDKMDIGSNWPTIISLNLFVGDLLFKLIVRTSECASALSSGRRADGRTDE